MNLIEPLAVCVNKSDHLAVRTLRFAFSFWVPEVVVAQKTLSESGSRRKSPTVKLVA